jgi:hypothetical protein
MTSTQCEPGITFLGEININAIAHVTKKSLWLMVIHATFKNISVYISWLSVLLMEETEVPKENHRPVASH